jgi:2-hydroxychromene-2-carboxylate isomerase
MELAFWYDFASTYSYVAAMRIGRLAAASPVAVRWRPFLLGPIFADQGWADSPFNIYPAKGRYMWRDMERLCARERLALRRPSVFPRNSVLAARIALIAGPEGWCPTFTTAVFAANFAEDRNIAEPATLADILAALGQPPDTVLARAATRETRAALRAQTGEARRLGIFGAPSFIAGEELFWGTDRLDDAIAWQAGQRWPSLGAEVGEADRSPRP